MIELDWHGGLAVGDLDYRNAIGGDVDPGTVATDLLAVHRGGDAGDHPCRVRVDRGIGGQRLVPEALCREEPKRECAARATGTGGGHAMVAAATSGQGRATAKGKDEKGAFDL